MDAQQAAIDGFSHDRVLFDVSFGLRQNIVADKLVVLNLGLGVNQDADGLFHSPLLGILDCSVTGYIPGIALDGRHTFGGDGLSFLSHEWER